MPWRAILNAANQAAQQPLVNQDELGLTPAEWKALQSIANSNTGVYTRVQNAVRMFVGAMRAARYRVNSDDTVPDQLRPHILNFAVWDFLTSYPSLKAMATAERKAKSDAAQRIFESISSRDFGAIEDPSGADLVLGNWNSEQKIIMRTHPVPSPQLQFQQTQLTQPMYANPNATTDAVPSNSPAAVAAPTGIVVAAGLNAGTLQVFGDPVLLASTYNIYRSTTSGDEGSAPPYKTGITQGFYLDAGLASGQSYFYQIQSVNAAGQVSTMSVEAVGSPN